jgi:RND family efflux transporter MFP subunit
MKIFSVLLLLLLVAGAAGYGGYWYARRDGAARETTKGVSATTQSAEEEEQPVVPVTTTPLVRRRITETVAAYGTVVAQPGEVRTLSVPFEARVTRVLVAPGQSVSPGTDVAQVESSPDALVALQEAKNAVDAAARDLDQTRQRFNDRLATNQELSLSRQALTSAKLKRDSLVQRGVGQSHVLKADLASVVSKVNVQQGQIVPAGTSLVDLAAQDRIEARLGVDPADVSALKAGQPIRLHRADRPDAGPIEGRVRVVEQRVDPATRLVPVSVAVPPDTHLLLDSFVIGDVVRASADALVVPRDAVVTDEDGRYAIYTVKDDHAVTHAVRLGLQSGRDVQVLADGLNAGDPVVLTGSYLLEDGMQVAVQAPAGRQPTTAPASTEPEGKP